MLIFNSFQLSHLSAFSQDWQFPRLEKCQISFPSPDADATTRCHNIPFQKLRESDMMNEGSDTSQVGPRSMLVLVDSHFDMAKHMYKFPLHIIQSVAVGTGETRLSAPHVNHPLPFDFRMGQEENAFRLTLSQNHRISTLAYRSRDPASISDIFNLMVSFAPPQLTPPPGYDEENQSHHQKDHEHPPQNQHWIVRIDPGVWWRGITVRRQNRAGLMSGAFM